MHNSTMAFVINYIMHHYQKGGTICIMLIPPIRQENLNLSKNI